VKYQQQQQQQQPQQQPKTMELITETQEMQRLHMTIGPIDMGFLSVLCNNVAGALETHNGESEQMTRGSHYDPSCIHISFVVNLIRCCIMCTYILYLPPIKNDGNNGEAIIELPLLKVKKEKDGNDQRDDA